MIHPEDRQTIDLIDYIDTQPPLKAQTVGYVRVSSSGQNTARQLNGFELDKVFIDKITGTQLDRPQLNALLEYVREGDTVLIHSLDRLARDLEHLIKITKVLGEKGVILKSVTEGLVFDLKSNNPLDKFAFHMLGALAELMRNKILEYQAEGIAKAKEKGDVYKGRKPLLNEDQIIELEELIKQKASSIELYKSIKWKNVAAHFGVSEPTLMRYIKKIKAQ